MGLFRRHRDAEGLYRGDAPVSAPGIDGAEPSAYSAQSFVDPAPHVATSPPGMTYPAGVAGGVPPIPTPVAGEADGPPPRPATAAGALNLSPQQAAAIQLALNQRPKLGRAGGLILAIVLLAVLIPAGIAIYFGVTAAKSAIGVVEGLQVSGAPAASGADAGDGAGGRHYGAPAAGEAVSVSIDGAVFDVAVFSAISQPGDAWTYASAGSEPYLIVDAEITRTDDGTDPVRVLGWNWSVIGTDGKPVMGDIITHYLPALDSPDLVGGQTERGFVTFRTAVRNTTLTLADGPSGRGLVTWKANAGTPDLVDGVIGEPAQGEISRPGFTVTIGDSVVVTKAEPRVGYYPKTGQYLVFPVEFTASAGTSGYIGNVDSEAFVFVPEGAPALYPTFGGVDDAFSFVSIDAAAPERGYLAFDTAASTGTLELRDAADRTAIRWKINGEQGP